MTDPHAPIWCPRCGEYRALPHLKFCPICLDNDRRATTQPARSTR